MWVGQATPLEDGRVHHLARVFQALRLAIADLDEYYDRVSKDRDIPELKLGVPHPRLFPHPTKFTEYAAKVNERKRIEFEYIDQPSVGPSNVTFIAKVKSSDRKLVIKFVERYGVEAHKLLADKGMAPRLLYCGLLDGENDVRDGRGQVQGSIGGGGLYIGSIRMVVMDYIEGSTFDKAPRLPENTHTQIEEAIETLHEDQLVFGDLRPPNVMISENGDKVYLIDFDWSGKVNEARYPLHLSRGVIWPDKPENLELKLILTTHDGFMLKQLFHLNPR